MSPEEYQRVTRGLARATVMPDELAATLEQRLERAFQESTGGERGASHAPQTSGMFVWWAAAAALVLAIGGTGWALRGVSSAPGHGAGLKPGAPAQDAGVNSGSTTPQPWLEPTIGKQDGVKPVTSTRQAHRRHELPAIVRPAGFIPLSAARELPQFESGVIVRMSLPVAALPSYGVDISPASSAEAVEADVLVAQDGVARAIRLVNTSRSQQ